MPRKILGYPLTVDWRAKKPQMLELPIYGAKPLSVELVDGSFVLYVEHDLGKGQRMRRIFILKAGQEVDSFLEDYTFVGTVVNGPWAWHVYIAVNHIVGTASDGERDNDQEELT